MESPPADRNDRKHDDPPFLIFFKRKHDMDNDTRKQMICITAAPRSGNSLFALALRAAGVNFGEDEEFRPALAGLDPAATCEHLLLEEIQDQALSAFKQSWFRTGPLPPDWINHPAMITARENLKNALSWSSLGSTGDWGWKSVAGARLLPLWTSLAAELEVQPRLIIPLRNPLEIARSLQRGANLPIEQGLRLWTLHILSVLEQTPSQQHCFFSYDGFLAQPERTAGELLAFLGYPATPERVARVAAVVNPQSRHIPLIGMDELIAVAGTEVAALYQHCLVLAGQANGPAPARRIQDLEDYRRMADLFNFPGSDKAPAWMASTFFFDTGNGYCPENAERRLIPYLDDLSFSESFRLPQPGTRVAAFSPGKGISFHCKIDKIETDGEFRGILKKTAMAENEGWEVFVPNAPLPVYELDGDFTRATYVKISGWMKPGIVE
jgi:hypothetical protein